MSVTPNLHLVQVTKFAINETTNSLGPEPLAMFLIGDHFLLVGKELLCLLLIVLV